MEVFEKWWDEECKTNIGTRLISPKEFAEAGWRAALEWANEEGGFGFGHIEKELEGE